MYLLIYCVKFAPWGITIKKIQNECTARSKSFPNFKMLDSFIIAMEMRHKEDGRLPCSSACKTKQGTMTSSTKAAFCRQSMNGLKETLTAAHRSRLWQQTWAMMNGSPPTHTSELTLGRGSRGRTMIASRKQSFPSQAARDTPYLQSWYGRKNFFHALIDQSVPTSLVHSSSIYCRKVPGNL